MPVTHFDSVGQFVRNLPNGYKDAWRDAESLKWAGGLTYAQCKKKVFTGDEKLLRESDKVLNQLEDSGLVAPETFWTHDVAGYLPCVPSYLAGAPESMRRMDHRPSESAPIRIYVDLFISWTFTEDEVMRRGITLLALARKLQAVRPVELYVLMACGKDNEKDDWISPQIKLETSPLDLSIASFMLGHPGFVRQMCFAWCVSRGANDCIPHFAHGKNRINPGPNDLYIDNACHARDILKDPVAWVNAQVKRFTQDLAESA